MDLFVLVFTEQPRDDSFLFTISDNKSTLPLTIKRSHGKGSTQYNQLTNSLRFQPVKAMGFILHNASKVFKLGKS